MPKDLHSAMITARNKVPPEVWEDIFHFPSQTVHLEKMAYDDSTNQTYLSEPQSKPRHLKAGVQGPALVCHQWYHIITMSCRMWVLDIVLAMEEDLRRSHIAQLLEGSLECDIDLRFKFEAIDNGP